MIDMQEFNFITAVSLVLEMIAVLVITYKIEKKKLEDTHEWRINTLFYVFTIHRNGVYISHYL